MSAAAVGAGGAGPPFVDQHRDELLDEQRIALGRGRHPRAHRRSEPGLPEQPVHHLLGLVAAQRSEHDPLLARALAPGRPLLEQVVPGRAEDQRRHDQVGRGQMLDEIEQGRLGGVDVVDDDDERTAIGEHLDQPLDGPERLGERKRRIAEAGHRREPLGDVLVADEAAQLGPGALGRIVVVDLGGRSDDLDQGPERDAPAIRQAAAAHDVGLLGHRREELAGQPRLADAGVSDDRDGSQAALFHGRGEGLAETSDLRGTADHRARLDSGGVASPHCLVADRDQPICRHSLQLALELERSDLLDLDGLADEAIGQLADQDLVGRRRLLEPRRGIHGIAGDESLPARRVAGHDLARVHAGAVGEPDAPRCDRARRSA